MPLFVFGIKVMLILHHELGTISKGLCRIGIFLNKVLVENSPFWPAVLCEKKLTINLLFFGIYRTIQIV